MSNRPHRRRRARRPGHLNRSPIHATEGDVYAVEVAWCEDVSDIPMIKKGTHDHLIEAMGDRRTGRVEWLLYHGTNAVDPVAAMLDNARGRGDAQGIDVYEHVLSLVNEHGGHVVIALAAGTP